MSTTAEFPESQWDQLKSTMEQDGPDAVIAFIDGFTGDERLKLYSFAQGAFNHRDWNGKNLDAYVTVGNAGIAQALAMSAAESDPERAMRLKDFANMMSYNFSAALAECWPDDDLPRERRHFQEGLRAAENCIRWRQELDKPPAKRAIAYWAQGMHALSLGDLATAHSGFGASLEWNQRDAAQTGKPQDPTPESGFGIILSVGYLGIADAVAGKPEGREMYRRAREAFEAQAADTSNAERSEDATFGLAQLGKVAGKYGVE